MKSVKIFSSYFKNFDSWLFSDPWSACFPYGSIDKSIWRTYTVYCRCCFEDVPPPTICCSTVTFSSSDQTGTVTDCHVHISTAIFCQLTCVLQRAIYRPTSLNVHYICKCSAVPIENIYCGLVLLFYCCCIGGVCEVLRVKVRLMAYIFTLDWWVQKWYGCKYFV